MSPLFQFLLMLILTALWSPSFLFIKYAIAEFHPIAVATLRVSLAALLLLGLLLGKGRSLPTDPRFWFHTTVMALFASVLPFALFSYAEQTIESALAAILNGTTPMFTAILAHLFIPSDRLHKQKIVGILLSILGIVLLFAPKLQGGISADFTGMIAGLAASFFYAVSHVYAKKHLMGLKPFVAPTSQLIASSLLLAPVFYMTSASEIDWSALSYSAMGGIIGLAVFGTFFAFILYYKLLEVSGPTAISMVACFFPVGGMVLGFLFLGETFTLSGLGACLLILFGIVTVNDLLPKRKFYPRLEIG